MHARLTTLVLMLSTAAVVAQLPAQQPAKQAPKQTKIYTSAKEVVAMMAKAKSDRKQDQATFVQNLIQLAPYTANLEYRASVGPAAVHDKEAEMFYVVEGSGTLVTGGKLVGDNSGKNSDTHTGTAIEGGMSQEVSKGDFFIVPEKTAHWFSKINGGALVMMSIHLPRS